MSGLIFAVHAGAANHSQATNCFVNEVLKMFVYQLPPKSLFYRLATKSENHLSFQPVLFNGNKTGMMD